MSVDVRQKRGTTAEMGERPLHEAWPLEISVGKRLWKAWKQTESTRMSVFKN